jgi:hypothetical protein
MCAQKAKFFYEPLGLEGELNSSVGWLTRFKQLYAIREIAFQGEQRSANDAPADMFRVEFKKFVHEENLKPDNVYNADESGLHWEGLPARNLAFERQKCAPGHKSRKERLPDICNGNVSGNHKLKPVMFAKRTLSFKGNEALFHKHFVPEVRAFLKERGLSQKAVLLLDNAPPRPRDSVLTSTMALLL